MILKNIYIYYDDTSMCGIIAFFFLMANLMSIEEVSAINMLVYAMPSHMTHVYNISLLFFIVVAFINN